MAGQTPYADDGTTELSESPGWRYLPFEARDGELAVTVVRDGDGLELRFSVPALVQRGAELGQITRIVIEAQERLDRSKGLGA
jgi:hypothetical protein